jgi:hypothetical protein
MSLEKSNSTSVIISALGFEDRSLESIKSILATWKAAKIFLIEYAVPGKTDEIVEWIKSQGLYHLIHRVDSANLMDIISSLENVSDCLLDITALSKPIIFKLVNEILTRRKKLYVAYTEAEDHYPEEEELKKRFEYAQNKPEYQQFDDIMENLPVGENTDEYTIVPQIERTEYLSSRPTVLFGFVVAKNQRILTLLEQINYASIELFLTHNESYRSKLAQMAAGIAESRYGDVEIRSIKKNDPVDILQELFDKYASFHTQGCNIELALTGTKWQTLACAALSSVKKISQCWYVEPKERDTEHYSKGAKNTIYYRVTSVLP